MLIDFLITLIADWLVVVVVLVGGVGILLATPKKQMYQAFSRGLLAGLVALLFAKIISLFYQGERPFVELGIVPKAAYLNNPGFPSDHVLFVFAITLVVWASTKNKQLGIILLVMSALVAWGRVLALVHTIADVLGGIACVAAAALFVYGLPRLLPARQ